MGRGIDYKKAKLAYLKEIEADTSEIRRTPIKEIPITARVAEVIRLRVEEQLTIDQIRERLGYKSRSGVGNILIRYLGKTRRIKQESQIIKLRIEKNLSIREISKIVGMSKSQVGDIVVKHLGKGTKCHSRLMAQKAWELHKQKWQNYQIAVELNYSSTEEISRVLRRKRVQYGQRSVS